MADSGVYLAKMAAFSRMLLSEGLNVRPRETEDACRILVELGLEDRETVKTALRTVYAKSREEQKTFDRVFGEFFLPEDALCFRNSQVRQELSRRERNAREELKLNGAPMDFTQAQRMAYGAMDDAQRQRLQAVLDKYRDSAARNPELYNQFIHSIFARSIMEQQLRMEDAAANAQGMAADPELGLLYRDISEFRDGDIPQAVGLIQRITRQINGERSARSRRDSANQLLDFRKTIRKGLETGGSLYRLKYRKTRGRRRKLVLLCDVSGSMIQFSEFALRFIQQLDHASEASRVFLFSEAFHEADRYSLGNLDRFRDYVRKTGLYGRGTDLAQALEALNARKPAALNSATTLLILSDTKTTGQKRALKALAESRRLAGRVIILNPIPERRWKYMQGVQAFAAAADMMPCANLKDLAAACRKLTNP